MLNVLALFWSSRLAVLAGVASFAARRRDSVNTEIRSAALASVGAGVGVGCGGLAASGDGTDAPLDSARSWEIVSY